MRFISAQPFDLYFVWQIEVQIVNFRKFGISDKMEVIVWYPSEEKLAINYPEWKKLIDKYPEVKFFFYKDQGVNLWLYIPQLRPHILAQHFEAFPELSKEVIFYHDSDIIFNYLPDFEELSKGDDNWTSDTSSYLDYDYLHRKEITGNIPENEAVGKLASIGKISVDILKEHTGNTGGAQSILKNIDADFWKDVERQCIEIRQSFYHAVPDSINAKYFPSEAAGYQSWCADMWALNMALWNRGRVVNTTPLLDFSWATDSAETYHKKPIMHNAGATDASQGLFYKGKWINKSPIGLKHAVKKDTASYFYVQAIEAVK